MAATQTRRRPSTTSTAAARLFLLTALAGCASSACRSIVAGDALYGEVVSHSFQGGGGSIIFEDGTVLDVVPPHGASTCRVPTETLETIATAMRGADFFAIPQDLHNYSVFDASSISVFVATSARLHWSSNYAVDDPRHLRAQQALRVRCDGPRTPLSPEALDAVVAAYIARSRSSAKAEAARRWLAEVRRLLERPGLRQ